MRQSKKWLVGLMALALLVTSGYYWRSALSLLVFERMMLSRLATDPLQALPDGLHVGLCGAGSPMPDPERSAPCTLVIAGARLFVVDTGSRASTNISRMGFDLGQIEAVLLTHFHSDHIGGLGDLMLNRWSLGTHATPLPVYGPIGVQPVVDGFMQAYLQDHLYRIAHHGTQVMIPSGFGAIAKTFAVATGAAERILIDEPDLTVSAFAVHHTPVEPAVGYTIRYKDRSVVISGDTAPAFSVQSAAQGVDVLVHEALSPPLVHAMAAVAEAAGRTNLAKIFRDIPTYHSTPEQAAQIAKSAGVRYLLLTHIVPPLPLPGLRQIFLGNSADIFSGVIKIGIDGDFVSLPVGAKAIKTTNRL